MPINTGSNIVFNPDNVEVYEDLSSSPEFAESALKTKLHMKSGKTFSTELHMREIQALVVIAESDSD